MKRCHRGGCGQGGEDACCPGKSNPNPPCNGDDGAKSQPAEQKMETEQPANAENSGEWSFDQQRGFLHNVGEAVTSFLEPFGVKVDVDVVDKKAPSEAAGGPPSGGEAANTQAAEVRGMSLHI